MGPLRWPLNAYLLNTQVIQSGSVVCTWTSCWAAFDVRFQTAGVCFKCQWNLLPSCWTASTFYVAPRSKHELLLNFLILCKLYWYNVNKSTINSSAVCFNRRMRAGVICLMCSILFFVLYNSQQRLHRLNYSDQLEMWVKREENRDLTRSTSVAFTQLSLKSSNVIKIER